MDFFQSWAEMIVKEGNESCMSDEYDMSSWLYCEEKDISHVEFKPILDPQVDEVLESYIKQFKAGESRKSDKE